MLSWTLLPRILLINARLNRAGLAVFSGVLTEQPPTRVSTMKLLLVLVLALLSGCNANVMRPNQPKAQVDMVKEAFWDYVAKATSTAEDSLKLIRQSELGKEVNTLISESTGAINKFTEALRSQATLDFTSRFFEQAEQLKIRLEKDLKALGANLQPYADEVVTHLQKQVEELKKEASAYAETLDSEALKAAVLRKSQELKGHLDKNVDQLQTQMVPYSQELKQKMETSLEDFRRNMTPLFQSFHSQLTEKSQQFQERLVPYGEELRAKLNVDTQNLKDQLAALWNSFTKLTQ
ncbi:apolipoprotein A-IV a [Dunckerocampus dactyliophorus]|uniref:apolipoprotein A-IV a n=1 Tax=Dunckerocampus dactyliophorus TaxID=161453 RepID=UPI0024073B1E|nr:apolipoprotein A-IV a [Dunckerocampus dactyliophorus]XP_054620100.1 apolipoprotein A-IV a [Dunckerocampus dactyliophorus]XP_054620101.1 apolipoprotein A-IV a [Dunckerocampus dactyliophorus]XP_054620102.1 apolipoprotein A-IV a [Dunckerocampus dactyliophorus]